ncbi:MAG: hypothetical protein ACR2L8_13615 [Solirubrobacteraceae bacterium]
MTTDAPPVPAVTALALAAGRGEREDATIAGVVAEVGHAAVARYRVRAMEHFAKGQEAISLPHFAPPLLVAAMWSLLALVAIAFVLAVSITVPTYSQAAALLVERGQEGWPTVVALFPPSETGRVRRGQEVRLTLPGSEHKVTLRIGQVEGVLSAEEIRRRFELSPAAAAAVSGPAAFALMPLRLPLGAGRPADFVDTFAVADGHLGDRRIVSLLPVIGD